MKWVFFAVVTLAYGYECIAVGKPQFGRIAVIAGDSFDVPLRDAQIEIIEIGAQKKVDSRKPLPYGYYRVRVEVPGFKRFQREVVLDQPYLAVRAALSVSMECGGSFRISGTIKSAAKRRELWVKAVPVRGVGGSESRVETNGEFLIGGLEFGTYVLIVMDGDRAIHAETVFAKIEIDKSVSIGI